VCRLVLARVSTCRCLWLPTWLPRFPLSSPLKVVANAWSSRRRRLGPRRSCDRLGARWPIASPRNRLFDRSRVPAQGDISKIENGHLDARWSTIKRLSDALALVKEPKTSLANGGYSRTKPDVSGLERWEPSGKARRSISVVE
jgi:hypothetical protein